MNILATITSILLLGIRGGCLFLLAAHLARINDETNLYLKSEYNRVEQAAQAMLCEMKNKWWMRKGDELQAAANRHNMKTFY